MADSKKNGLNLNGFEKPFKNGETSSKKINEKGTFTLIIILSAVFLSSFFGFFLMWFTELYNNAIISNLVLSNESSAFEWWLDPPLKTYLKVHIFNYTNVEQYMDETDKTLKVQDLGPFVYEERVEKYNLNLNNSKLTYNERRTFKFQPLMSKGLEIDMITVPNIPMMSVIKNVKSSMMKAIGSNAVFSTTNSYIFKTLTASSFLWGYQDDLVDYVNENVEKLSFTHFGMLINRKGNPNETMTINTGEADIRRLAVFEELNGKNKMDLWDDEECDAIDGSDGTQFPPHMVDQQQNLSIFVKDICRKFPLTFEKEVTVFEGVQAWRYKAPIDAFAHPDINPNNQCFCHKESGVCPYSGTFNLTSCSRDAPIFVSFPHFLGGEKYLFEKVEGLHPDPIKHVTFADIHPRLGFPVAGASRFQINLEVQTDSFVSGLGPLVQGDILPIVWLEVVPGEFDESLKNLIYHSSFSANAVQLGLRWGTAFICLISLLLLIAAIYCRMKVKELNVSSNQVESTKLNTVENRA